MTQTDNSTEGFADPFADSNHPATPIHHTESVDTTNAMDVDPYDELSDPDSTISTSLPTSFFSGMKSLEHRRVSASVLSTPQTVPNPMLLDGERAAAMPRRRVLTSIPQRNDDDDIVSTPTRPHGPSVIAGAGVAAGATINRPAFSRSSSLLTRMHEKGTLLGKHPQTPSPGEEPGTRSKGFKTLASKAIDRPPTLPDFSTPDTSGLDRSSPLYSPIPPPNFGTPPGTPLKASAFGLFSSIPLSPSPSHQPQSPVASPFGRVSSAGSDDNPFLGSSNRKARFEMDYLSESQWYSDYPHHLTEEYLEELFRLDKRVMFTKTKLESGDSPDYLKSNFYVSEAVLGQGVFSDVLKVQSKQTKEFFAVKRLLKTVQGAMERKQYLNEVRNMWRVEKSPNVLQLLEAWEQKGKIYMRMELCRLGSLKSALLAQKKYGGFDERRTWKCLTDLASGLRAIHDSNIIHLDIKPDNVFITSAGRLKIGDFGLSITYPVEVKDVNEGDKYYMAQELLNGECGKFSDVFSLGITIYEMVTNQTGDLPGEGLLWHRLRDGDFEMGEYMIGAVSVSGPSSSSSVSSLSSIQGVPESQQQQQQATTATPTAASTETSVFVPFEEPISMRPLDQASSRHRKIFSKELLDLIKKMMQPAFETRPTAAAIMRCRTIHQVLVKRSEQGGKAGTRSDEAMSGLLLQSI